MKVKILVRLVESLLKMKDHGDEPRADMYLPEFLLAFAIVLLLLGVGSTIAFVITLNYILALVAVGLFLLCVAAVMCWRNQTICIISNDAFVYTTFFGNSYTYRFSDITSVRQNPDSTTIFVGNKKIHIESMAVVSNRLLNRINSVLRTL